MKVTLVTLQDDLNCYGLRCLSSVLKENGVDVRLIFLDRYGPQGAATAYQGESIGYSDKILEELAAMCGGSDLIGFSVMTMYFDESARISDLLRLRLGCPVIWGGMHAICEPEECLQHADIVCLGEAEGTIAEVAERISSKRSLKDVTGIWYRNNESGKIIRNMVRQPERSLDVFPHPDISLEGHYVLDGENIRPLTRGELLARWTNHYMTINARGCALRCTYCCNSQLARRFDWTFVRHKSVDNFMGELKGVRSLYPEVDGIKLSDDSFGDLPMEYIRDFSIDYRRHIGIPLGIPGFSPQNLTEEKLRCLTEAGLVYLRLGIQSGSPGIRKLYGRHESNEQIVNAVRMVNRYMPGIERLKLDVITDNPWETDEDTIATINLLLQFPKPYVLALFSLTLFPGTPLYIRAKREGMISGKKSRIYNTHFRNLEPKNRLNKILALFRKPVVLHDKIKELVSSYRNEELFNTKYKRYLEEAALLSANAAPERGW